MSLQYLCSKIYSGNQVTCINSGNLNLIQQGIKKILKQEGFQQISKPTLPQDSKPMLQKLLSSPWQMKGFLVIGLVRGNLGWTIVKTSEKNFFCKRAKNAIQPRLFKLAKYINNDTFAYSFHYTYLGALLEVNTNGEIFVSGYLDSSNTIEDVDIFYINSQKKTLYKNYKNHKFQKFSESDRKGLLGTGIYLTGDRENANLDYKELALIIDGITRDSTRSVLASRFWGFKAYSETFWLINHMPLSLIASIVVVLLAALSQGIDRVNSTRSNNSSKLIANSNESKVI